MKKAAGILLIITLVLTLCSCYYSDPVIDSLPEYKNKSFYTSGGFQDYTDYAKYTYESVAVQEIKASKYFSMVTDEDIHEILLHIYNFEEWVKIIGGELENNYDFDINTVSAGDFFYIKTKAGQPIGQGTYGKYDYYTVYFFDVDTKILYYFHSNI